MYRGDLRYADRLGDLFSDAHYQGEKRPPSTTSPRSTRSRATSSSATDQIAYDVFENQTEEALKGFEPDILEISEALPMNHFFGIHTEYPTIAGGQGAAPFKTLADYENNLKRNRDFADQHRHGHRPVEKGRGGGHRRHQADGPQHDRAARQPAQDEARGIALLGADQELPRVDRPADRARLTGEYRESIATSIYPALQRMRDFLANEYLAHARDGFGLMYMKGGDKYYRYLIEQTTTEALDPEQVHQLGLSEVARITKEFEEVQREVGFKGTLHQFFDYMRTSPKFQPKSKKQLEQGFYAVKTKVEAKVPQFFSQVPKARLVIRPYPRLSREVRGRRKL